MGIIGSIEKAQYRNPQQKQQVIDQFMSMFGDLYPVYPIPSGMDQNVDQIGSGAMEAHIAKGFQGFGENAHQLASEFYSSITDLEGNLTIPEEEIYDRQDRFKQDKQRQIESEARETTSRGKIRADLTAKMATQETAARSELGKSRLEYENARDKLSAEFESKIEKRRMDLEDREDSEGTLWGPDKVAEHLSPYEKKQHAVYSLRLQSLLKRYEDRWAVLEAAVARSMPAGGR